MAETKPEGANPAAEAGSDIAGQIAEMSAAITKLTELMAAQQPQQPQQTQQEQQTRQEQQTQSSEDYWKELLAQSMKVNQALAVHADIGGEARTEDDILNDMFKE